MDDRYSIRNSNFVLCGNRIVYVVASSKVALVNAKSNT